MKYEGDIYRPPSEADSLIVQYTVGCARNSCTFCSMYKAKKFRVRPDAEVISELEQVAQSYAGHVKKVFLADGDALIVPTQRLMHMLGEIKRLFPLAGRITAYGAPADILEKTDGELRALSEAGLDMVYMGLESGDEQVLRQVKKGIGADEIAQAGIKLRASGIRLSMTIISGLGGAARMRQHAQHSAEIMNRIKPEYASLLTLMLQPGTPLYTDVQNGLFTPLGPEEVMEETLQFLRHSDSEGTVFRMNHASNYLALAGTLNSDKEKLIRQVEGALLTRAFKPENARRL